MSNLTSGGCSANQEGPPSCLHATGASGGASPRSPRSFPASQLVGPAPAAKTTQQRDQQEQQQASETNVAESDVAYWALSQASGLEALDEVSSW